MKVRVYIDPDFFCSYHYRPWYEKEQVVIKPFGLTGTGRGFENMKSRIHGLSPDRPFVCMKKQV